MIGSSILSKHALCDIDSDGKFGTFLVIDETEELEEEEATSTENETGSDTHGVSICKGRGR